MTTVSSGVGIGGVLNPPTIPSTSVAGSIQMSLLALDKLVRIGVSGEVSLTAYNPAFDKWDAVAKCDVPVATIRNMFAFQSDHFDLNDTNPEDIRFYIDASQIPSALNLNNAVVNNGAVVSVNALNNPLTDADMVIQKDYVKHLANVLFNTPYGADLFINEEDLVNSVKTGLANVWTSCASDLQSVSTTGTHTSLQGDAAHKYLLANTSAEDAAKTSKYNICRELFRMLISRVPARFTDLPALQVSAAQATAIDPLAQKLYSIPLNAGDQVLMRVVLKPSETQQSFQNGVEDAIVRADTRAYIIALNLI